MPTVLTQNKNAEIVRRGYHAFDAGDVKTLAELFDEKASWHTPGKSILSGHHKGREAVLGYFARLGQESGGTFKTELLHVTADDENHVIGVHHSTAQRHGKKLAVDTCIIFELKNGKIISAKEFIYDLHAADAFFS